MILPTLDFEKSIIPSTCRYLLGIDEVGRGPLAGPVTIGAFLLDLQNFDVDTFIKLPVRDSKKLSESQRQKINTYFLANNFNFQVFSCTNVEIDHQGIAVCLNSLIAKALNFYRSSFDFCLIDGNYNADNFSNSISLLSKGEAAKPREILSVIQGDARCFSIASASIVAKVHRDKIMDEYDLLYPNYGFKTHKGYGTPDHLSAIKTYGPCPIHRQSFKPIKKS